jgi:hypothetical protein
VKSAAGFWASIKFEGDADEEGTYKRSNTSKRGSKRMRSSLTSSSDGSYSDEDRESRKKKKENGRGRSRKQVMYLHDLQAEEREWARLKAQSNPLIGKGEHLITSPARLAEKRRSRTQVRRNLRREQRRASLGERDTISPVKNLARSTINKTNDSNSCKDPLDHCTLHSTSWRRVRFLTAPKNLLPDDSSILLPFDKKMDKPLEDYDPMNSLRDEIGLVQPFSPPPTLTGVLDIKAQLEKKKELLHDMQEMVTTESARLKICHQYRVEDILRKTRLQIASYFSHLDEARRVVAKIAKANQIPLRIPKAELMASRQLLRNLDISELEEPCRYMLSQQTENGYPSPEKELIPDQIILLRQIHPIDPYTTYIGVTTTYRVEDDPISRYECTIDKEDRKDVDLYKFPGFEKKNPDSISVLEDEVKEYLLRMVVKRFHKNELDYLQTLEEIPGFAQPMTDYCELLERDEKRKRLFQTALKDEVMTITSSDKLNGFISLVSTYYDRMQGKTLRDRLLCGLFSLESYHLAPQNTSPLVHGIDSDAIYFKSLKSNYSSLFCRQCYVFVCANHGINQPEPSTRADPQYPIIDEVVKRLSGDSFEPQEMNQTIETDLSSEYHGGNTIQEDVEDENLRRSARSQTAASTRASTSAVLTRKYEKNRNSCFSSRSYPQEIILPTDYDISEYLDQELPCKNELTNLLSNKEKCSKECSKLESVGFSDSGGLDQKCGTQRGHWVAAERFLLKQAISCMNSSNSCVLARLLNTKSCSEVAVYLNENSYLLQNATSKYNFGKASRNNSMKARFPYAHNHMEHVHRTRFLRMKEKNTNRQFQPCDHGSLSCNSSDCSCMARDHFCEKSCGCPRDCANRFPGCKCGPGQCGTSACPCYFAGRECDPDTCGSCGASDLALVSSKEERKERILAQKACQNVNIRYQVHKKIGISSSTTHGWGAFVLEDVKEGEFLYEYTGGIVSQDEAERRGIFYDRSSVSFLFDVDEDCSVDATRKGNKMKFANHEANHPKYHPEIMCVSGDHRIGIYANQNIKKGDEIFFNYGYNGVVPDWSQARITATKKHNVVMPTALASSTTITSTVVTSGEPENEQNKSESTL